MAGVFFFTFIALMIVNWVLWNYIKAKGLKNVNSKRNIYISLVYAISFIYRGVYDLVLATQYNLNDYSKSTLWYIFESHV
jgi:hypothetical protein